MSQTKERETDDDYMYKFRTKPCTKKRCRNPPKCFDAHSEVMRRRVPSQGEHGLYNYIPEPCRQWEKLKKCSLGASCLRSHGWLEQIFHPLLYKTKMCKSNQKNGICREYGVYCAKAHNPSDIRNLVKIYGENWKRHYDLTLREKLADSSGVVKVQKKYKELHNTLSKKQSVGNSFSTTLTARVNRLCSEQTLTLTSIRTSPMLTSVQPEIDPHSPLLFTSPLLFGDCIGVSDCISTLTLEEGVTSYTQLYGEKDNMFMVDDSDLKNSKSLLPKVSWDCTLHSIETYIAAEEPSATFLSNSNFRSPFGENWKNDEKLDIHRNIYGQFSLDNKENRPSNRIEENSESLFAQPHYDARCNKNFFDLRPETPEGQQLEN